MLHLHHADAARLDAVVAESFARLHHALDVAFD
jgi:hypothetical protein